MLMPLGGHLDSQELGMSHGRRQRIVDLVRSRGGETGGIRRVSRSRMAASASLRCVMSRAIDDAPTTLPSASQIGDTATETSTRRPSFRIPTVS